MGQKVILLHGFSREEVLAAMRAIKTALPAARDAAFATTTETNLTWKVTELLEQVAKEHEAMTKAVRKA